MTEPPQAVCTGADYRTKVIQSLSNLLDEADKPLGELLKHKAFLEEGEAAFRGYLQHVEEVIEISKAVQRTSSPTSAGNKLSDAICYLERLRAVMLLPKNIKLILHDRRSLNTVREFLKSHTPHSVKEGHAKQDPDVIDALNFLLAPRIPFPENTCSQLTSGTLSPEGLHNAMQRDVGALCNTARFPGGALLQALHFLQSALYMKPDPDIHCLLDAMGNALSKAMQMKHDLNVIVKNWPVIQEEYKNGRTDEEFLGEARSLGETIGGVMGNVRLFFDILWPEIRCVKKDDPLAFLSSKSEFDVRAVRHLMGKITPRNMARCISMEIRQSELGEDAAEGARWRNGGLEESKALLKRWGLVLKGDLEGLEPKYRGIMETFKKALDLQVKRMMHTSKKRPAPDDVAEQKHRMAKIVNEVGEKTMEVLVVLERLRIVVEKRAMLEGPNAIYHLIKIQSYLARYADSLFSAKKDVDMSIEGGGDEDFRKTIEKHMLSLCVQGWGFARPDLSEEVNGLHLMSFYACGPGTPKSEVEAGLTDDAPTLKYKIKESVEMFKAAVHRECMPMMQLLQAQRTSPKWGPTWRQGNTALLRFHYNSKREVIGAMSGKARELLDCRVLLLEMLLGEKSLEQYLEKLLDGAQQLTDRLLSMNRVTPKGFAEAIEKVHQAASASAGLVCILDRLLALQRSGNEDMILAYIREGAGFLENMDANAVQQLETQAQDELERTNFQGWWEKKTPEEFVKERALRTDAELRLWE